jgi:60 kDa SS-A/Ro ribonucleoprotein
VRRIVEISDTGRAPKNDPAIFALALAASLGNDVTRRAALDALPRVCRIGTHLFHFAEYVDGMRGWGRGLRAAVASWYNAQDAGKLAFQAVKYQQRDGWSNRDLLRLAHPNPSTETHKAIYWWMTKGWESVGDEPHPDANLRILWAFERAKQVTNAREIAALLREYGLPREAVPTEWLNEVVVWEALLEQMPMTAMIRNLATMTRVGLLDSRENVARVVDQVTDERKLKSARIHPIAALSALKTYAQGHGERGQNTWKPIQKIVDALDSAFYASFGNVTPTGKRWHLGLDVSGSMGCGYIAGTPGLTPMIATAAMAMVTAAVQPDHTFTAFSHELVPCPISPRQRLDDVIKTMQRIPMGGTDCSLPMRSATAKKEKVDVFVVLTDSETWAGNMHPAQALQEYRQRMGIPAKLVVVGMTSNGFTIADPNDAGMLDVVGFDTATPNLMADFASR